MANDSGTSTAGSSTTDPAVSTTRSGLTPDELEDAWRRALNDLDDARKEHARELAHEVEAERHRVCMAWLPVLDGLELAFDQADSAPAVLIGVRSVRDQAIALLASLGFARDDETGVPFDSQRHEVADVVDDPDVAPGTVVKVLRPGYGRPPARQLRPAVVLVSRGSGRT